MIRRNKGQWFQTGIGGTYPVNDGDPQNEDETFNEAEAADAEDDAIDAELERRENKECL